MPVLKIKNADGTWQEVWGGTGGGGAAVPKLTTVTVLADAWTGDSAPYSQVVSCNGVSENSKLDLQPTPEQIVTLQDSEIALMASNNQGVVTIHAFNDKPAEDMILNVLITEVVVV